MENVHKIDKNCDLAGVSCPLLISPPQLNTFHCHSREFHGVNPFASLTRDTEGTEIEILFDLPGDSAKSKSSVPHSGLRIFLSKMLDVRDYVE